MAESQPYSLSRYLEAKRSVDNRALNRRVWADFRNRFLEGHSEAGEMTLLDLAGGTGSTAQRLLESLPNNLSGEIRYTLVDIDARVIEEARRALPEWAVGHGFDTTTRPQGVDLSRRGLDITIELVCAEAFDYMAGRPRNSVDSIVTQAWLDLVHVETALKQIFRILDSDGLFYAPIHFEGETHFLPSLDDDLDRRVVDAYHRSMDTRETEYGRAGGRRTGSRLLTEIPEAGGKIRSVGSADWIVRPAGDDGYPNDEGYFLQCILRFVESEIANAESISLEEQTSWMQTRRDQIDSKMLRYGAHHLDIMATGDQS